MIRKTLLALVIPIFLISAGAGCDIVSPEPSVEQIKSDLIGETITQGNTTWHFHALSEYKDVTIVNRIREGNTIEYDIAIELQDIFSGTQYEADILMIYQRSGTSWELFSVLVMSLKATDGGTGPI
jgi:hypothetical protein